MNTSDIMEDETAKRHPNVNDIMADEIAKRSPDKWAEKIHAYKANKARTQQITDFIDELETANMPKVTPRAYAGPFFTWHHTFSGVKRDLHPRRFLP